MERTRKGQPIGLGRVDPVRLEAVSDQDTRRALIEAELDGDNPLGAFRAIPEISALRRKTGLTQERFAHALQIPVATLRSWEQGRTTPDPVAVAFFRLVNEDPERAFKVLSD